MSRDAKIGLLLVFASITLGLFLGFAEVMDREYIKVNGKDGGDGSEFNEEPVLRSPTLPPLPSLPPLQPLPLLPPFLPLPPLPAGASMFPQGWA
jgi:hypothetical protein